VAFSLVRCGADGSPLTPISDVPETIVATYAANADLYRRVIIAAFTLRESNASTKILQRLGLRLFGEAQDPDAGDVWEWRS